MAIQLRLTMTTMKWICRSRVYGSPDSAREPPASIVRSTLSGFTSSMGRPAAWERKHSAGASLSR